MTANYKPPLPPVPSDASAYTSVGDVVTEHEEPLSAFDLRLRSLDREPGEPVTPCSLCERGARWSVWLHAPEWGSRGGLTVVRCTPHALQALTVAAGGTS